MKKIKFSIEVPTNVKLIHGIFKKNGYDIFLVGGCVRDAFLGVKPKDWDLVTNANPDEVINMLKKINFVNNILETGKAFGVINCITTDGEYEIATMRKDLGSDGRRPDSVEFTDIATDILRRDITINALFYDIESGEITDLVGGLDDITNGVIRTVGKAEDRFKEDRLRIMRIVRFAGRFSSNLDAETNKVLLNDASLEDISGERIRDEFIKGIKSAKNLEYFLSLIEKYGLFNWIFNGLKVNKSSIPNNDTVVVLAHLLKDNDVTILGKKLNELKYTDNEIRSIKFLINLIKLNPDTAVNLKRQQEHTNITSDQIKVFCKLCGVVTQWVDAFIKFELSVSGQQVMDEFNIKAGPELGKLIHSIETDNFEKLLEMSDMGLYFRSDSFQKIIRKQIEKDTWGKGLPMYYSNDKNQLVEHWKDGRIVIVKDLNK